jgi:hypothetical protein
MSVFLYWYLHGFVGGKKLRRGSGFWIDWDEDTKTGIVLTTAELILTEYQYNVEQEYAHDAKVSR